MMLATARGNRKNRFLGAGRVCIQVGHLTDRPYHPRMPLLRHVELTRGPNWGKRVLRSQDLDNFCIIAIHDAEQSTWGRQLRMTLTGHHLVRCCILYVHARLLPSDLSASPSQCKTESGLVPSASSTKVGCVAAEEIAEECPWGSTEYK